jgi:hypothetical protein
VHPGGIWGSREIVTVMGSAKPLVGLRSGPRPPGVEVRRKGRASGASPTAGAFSFLIKPALFIAQHYSRQGCESERRFALRSLGPTSIIVSLDPVELGSLEVWIADQPDPKPSAPSRECDARTSMNWAGRCFVRKRARASASSSWRCASLPDATRKDSAMPRPDWMIDTAIQLDVPAARGRSNSLRTRQRVPVPCADPRGRSR